MSKPAQSVYRGIRLTVTQPPDPDSPCIVTLAVKELYKPWDDWSLLYPAIRVPVRDIASHEDVLRAVARTIEALIDADRKYR